MTQMTQINNARDFFDALKDGAFFMSENAYTELARREYRSLREIAMTYYADVFTYVFYDQNAGACVVVTLDRHFDACFEKDETHEQGERKVEFDGAFYRISRIGEPTPSESKAYRMMMESAASIVL